MLNKIRNYKSDGTHNVDKWLFYRPLQSIRLLFFCCMSGYAL